MGAVNARATTYHEDAAQILAPSITRNEPPTDHGSNCHSNSRSRSHPPSNATANPPNRARMTRILTMVPIGERERTGGSGTTGSPGRELGSAVITRSESYRREVRRLERQGILTGPGV